jgi:hypothetical protein
MLSSGLPYGVARLTLGAVGRKQLFARLNKIINTAAVGKISKKR